jgi:hypothetical protein
MEFTDDENVIDNDFLGNAQMPICYVGRRQIKHRKRNFSIIRRFGRIDCSLLTCGVSSFSGFREMFFMDCLTIARRGKIFLHYGRIVLRFAPRPNCYEKRVIRLSGQGRLHPTQHLYLPWNHNHLQTHLLPVNVLSLAPRLAMLPDAARATKIGGPTCCG